MGFPKNKKTGNGGGDGGTDEKPGQGWYCQTQPLTDPLPSLVMIPLFPLLLQGAMLMVHLILVMPLEQLKVLHQKPDCLLQG